MTPQEQYVKWLESGSPIPAPDYARTKLILELANDFEIKVFVETGTLVGSRVGAVKDFFSEVHSVELSESLYNRCLNSFREERNVHLYNGDSGELLSSIIEGINESCIYFLDAHYSGGLTAKGNKDSALSDELKAILPRLSKYDDVILVDDTYNLSDHNGYLSKNTVTNKVMSVRPDYAVEEKDFILMAYPSREVK